MALHGAIGNSHHRRVTSNLHAAQADGSYQLSVAASELAFYLSGETCNPEEIAGAPYMRGGRLFRRQVRLVDVRISQAPIPGKHAWYWGLFLRLLVRACKGTVPATQPASRLDGAHFEPDTGVDGRWQQEMPSGGQGIA